ncbi:hypothetical protein [Agrobacterium vitis]|uniref:Uncharacterized protein n=1 Tax=Agrobacterium vitis TaxID=373 RepID=A0A7K1RCA0_AGRVI|nr:hypothetical protein [Agrobacterium vitis]MVA55673.1 hypothetical protein [Agrobacterium vitis]
MHQTKFSKDRDVISAFEDMTLVMPEFISQKRAEACSYNAELEALFGWNYDAMAALVTKKPTEETLQAAVTKLNGNILSPHPKPPTPHLKNS